MDFRAVLIFVCLLIAQAACGPVGKTVQLMQREIEAALVQLAESAALPNTSCPPLNTTELVGPEQQPLTAHQLSFFRCLMLKMSGLNQNLTRQLRIISQLSQPVERLSSGRTSSRNCSLPSFEQEMCRYVYVKCLLQLLDQQLSKANFRFP